MALLSAGALPQQWAAVAGVAAFFVVAALAASGAIKRRRRTLSGRASCPTLPGWLQWLEESPTHYRMLLREWEDAAWRSKWGWHGSDLIHGPSSPVRIPCYFYSPSERTLRGPVTFGAAAESHRGFCHGGAMTSAMDDVLGHVSFLATGQGPWTGATVQVNCKLSKPVRVGQTLLIAGKVSRQEKRKVFIEATLSDEAGAVYATMEGLSVAGAQLQSEVSELERRQWVFDEESRTVFDSAWDGMPDSLLGA